MPHASVIPIPSAGTRLGSRLHHCLLLRAWSDAWVDRLYHYLLLVAWSDT